MPQVNNPNAIAVSIGGQMKELQAQLDDVKGADRTAPFSLTVGAGGVTDAGTLAVTGTASLGSTLAVAGATTLTGGVTGPVAATGALSGTTITGTGAITGASLTVGIGAIAGAIVGGPITGTTLGLTGTVTAGADINLTGDLYSPHGKITPVVSGYVSAYFNTDGRLGASVSARRFKQDITPKVYTLEQIALVQLVTYRLRTAVAELGDAARVEIGVIAEQLIDAGLREFVVFDDDNVTAMTVAYERLDLLGVQGVQLLFKRVQSIEARLTAGGL